MALNASTAGQEDDLTYAYAFAFTLSLKCGVTANSANAELFRNDLLNIARTTLSSKVLSQDKDYFAKLAVDAVMRLKVR